MHSPQRNPLQWAPNYLNTQPAAGITSLVIPAFFYPNVVQLQIHKTILYGSLPWPRA